MVNPSSEHCAFGIRDVIEKPIVTHGVKIRFDEYGCMIEMTGVAYGVFKLE